MSDSIPRVNMQKSWLGCPEPQGEDVSVQRKNFSRSGLTARDGRELASIPASGQASAAGQSDEQGEVRTAMQQGRAGSEAAIVPSAEGVG